MTGIVCPPIGALENFELDFQRGGAGDGARAHAQQNRVQRVGFAGRIAERDQAMASHFSGACGIFEWLSQMTPARVAAFDCGAQIRVIVAPEHLVMAGGAIQEQAPLLAQIEQVRDRPGNRRWALFGRRRRSPGARICRRGEQAGTLANGLANLPASRCCRSCSSRNRRPASIAAAISGPAGPRNSCEEKRESVVINQSVRSTEHRLVPRTETRSHSHTAPP